MMPNRSDQELLLEYARTGAQGAFTELVVRHVDLVYTAARRQVRDPHLAQDVTQAVFLVLARKAGSIGPKVVLQGWLLNATRYAARDALRKRSRRQRHESAAAQQRSHQVQRGEPSSPTDAERQEYTDRLDSVLDHALARLGAASRDAVVLRFFQNKSFHDVGAELGIGEEAAKQRVFRGLRQLRKILAQSGLEIPLEGVGAAIAVRGILPAPPGLAHAIAAAAGNAAVAATGSASLAKGAITVMAWTKAKVAAVTVAGLLLLSGGTAVVHHYVTGGERVVVLKPGAPLPPGSLQPAPVAVSAWGFGTPQFSAPAYTGPALTGTVVDSAGKPLGGVEVAVASNSFPVWVYPQPQRNIARGPMTTTSSDGHFQVRPSDQPSALVARCAAGYGAVVVSDATKPVTFSIHPWARLEGVVRSSGKPVPHARVQVAQYGDSTDWDRWHIVKEQQIDCDENGRFLIDRVVPGLNRIGRITGHTPMPQRIYAIDLPAGKTTHLNIGGDGRTIVGHLPPSALAFDYHNGNLARRQPRMPLPPDWDKLSEDRKQKLQQAFWATPEYKAWQQTAVMSQFEIARDGTFRIEDLPAGTYNVNVQVGQTSGHMVETAGWGSTPVTIGPITAAQIDQPLDIGQVKLTLEKRLEVGELVPEISGDSLDGSSARLSDHRGKYVLLYLWGTTWHNTVDTVGLLRTLDDRFGDDPRFAIVCVNFDQSADVARKAIAEQHMRWPQILVHGLDAPHIPLGYTLSPAMMFLIGPDGRLIAKNTDVAGMHSVLQRLLPPQMSNVAIDHQPPGRESSWFTSPPEQNVARNARFTLVDGQPQSSSAPLDCLHDGVLPTNSDSPTQNYFFANGTLEGRFKIDLGSNVPIAQVNTCSWHKSDRGPQVYKLYASTGAAPGFNASPNIGADPAACGWKLIASVDTRPDQNPVGGRYTVHIADPSGSLGTYRYLLFETYVTETANLWGHTFYGEVEVIRGK